ncbi:MAG: serine hydrolase [Candidatus Levybacteria bacterium]|nr:serine hydrolase [Candidatus Levybacteria bacterium]
MRIIKFILFIILTVVLIFLIYNLVIQKYNNNSNKLLSPLADVISSNINKIQNKNLKNIVEKELAETEGEYAVVIKNLKTNEKYYYNEHKVFEPGSLYKLWVMGEVFNRIKNGKISEDDTLEQDVAVLNEKFHIATESAEKTDGKITFNVKEALSEMITASDNYAALLLAEKIRLFNVSAFLKTNNFSESALGEPPKTTAYDMMLFFEKLYKGELVNPEYSGKMMELLKGQKLNGKLPKYLPVDAVLAHKTGEINNFSHDGGIVFLAEGDYIIVVLSKGKYRKTLDEGIARISKAVYEYFIKAGFKVEN